MKKETLDNIFVYGTLQHGQSRNYVLRGLNYEKATLCNYRKIEPENLDFPFILKDEGSEVKGEIYSGVSKELLESLDRIEGEGFLYHRILIEVETVQGKKVQAFTYYPDKKLIKNYQKSL